MSNIDDDPGLLRELIGDGRPALTLTAVMLFLSGAFAIFLSFRREFLPHDVAFLGMTAEALCAIADCRIVRFMFHDRVAFGGTLIAVATLYLWLASFPLRQGDAWAWWAFFVSGVLGFGSFLSYLGYGYFDSWHGTASLALLPVFVIGLVMSRSHARVRVTGWVRTADGRRAPPILRGGRWGLLATAAGIAMAGFVILVLGTTEVFVAEDLRFIGHTRDALDGINPRLVPLIAHDRAGFGGGLATTGVLLFMCGWYAPPTRAFHHAVSVAGLAGFGCAIGIHFVEGYVNPWHLAPAFAGAGPFATSILCELSGSSQMRRERLLERVPVEQSDLDPRHDWRPDTPTEPTTPEARRGRRGSSRVR